MTATHRCCVEICSVSLSLPGHTTVLSLDWDVSLNLTVSNCTGSTQCCSHLPLSPGLWGLVNNAGISQSAAPNQWLTKQDFVTILNVNLLGVIEVTLGLLPLVRKARGRVVNVSSILGRVSLFGGGYCISKYGIEAFSDSLRYHTGLGPGLGLISVLLREHFSGPAMPWDLQSMFCLNLSEVTDCMEHALTACHPRTRYSAGWDAKLLYLPLSYMPTFLVDAVVTWGLPRPEKAL
ncbi:retinol dehydrogenase 16-like [Otolemur garnettii]|uniref:retinol dehydrogenase 16-like n=1 Tax=Otolemur garnettii TaxID=30611 RepID=UPI000C7F1EB0|nr:retinol dehydrogenase 16-like [Otolemur garnettii]